MKSNRTEQREVLSVCSEIREFVLWVVHVMSLLCLRWDLRRCAVEASSWVFWPDQNVCRQSCRAGSHQWGASEEAQDTFSWSPRSKCTFAIIHGQSPCCCTQIATCHDNGCHIAMMATSRYSLIFILLHWFDNASLAASGCCFSFQFQVVEWPWHDNASLTHCYMEFRSPIWPCHDTQ